MKQLFLIISFLVSSINAIAQEIDLDKVADSIRAEAEVLYRSEFASWHGTDIFKEKCGSKLKQAGGYLSYDNGTNLINVFYSAQANTTVLATISFNYDFNPGNYKLDTTERVMNSNESALYKIRAAAIADMRKDTLYKLYNNTSLNPIPLVNKGKKMVYILTGPSVNGVVIFGNDYLLNFDDNNNITSKKTLHKNIIPIYTNTPDSKTTVAQMHTHLPETGDFITATDICTLRLYKPLSGWKQHYVTSKKYTSIWDGDKNDLLIMTNEALKRISEDHKERSKSSN
ncbi:hypothetical protein [Mucilaginibacter auburnensis]|uniref:Uncharacterized protein n=1 Tax=Mucilaginibacter auburnensis TaxID=1457233 RepID=A0A2H9VNL8_9SPHI|nr:hypothetical protein [Mucilaginibacter auburnensis]PJJ79934.1 hypothetical protein CLV57_3073 [Mucilaginibacter auburnensis]